MNITNEQIKALHQLKMDGLKREAVYLATKSAYEEAESIEQAVRQSVIDDSEYYIKMDDDCERSKRLNGERITDGKCDWLMDEDIFKSDYIPKCTEAFRTIYGIEHDASLVYSWPYKERYWGAEKQYLMIGVDFLRLCGQDKYADSLKKIVGGYMPDTKKAELKKLADNFVHGLPVEAAV